MADPDTRSDIMDVIGLGLFYDTPECEPGSVKTESRDRFQHSLKHSWRVPRRQLGLELNFSYVEQIA